LNAISGVIDWKFAPKGSLAMKTMGIVVVAVFAARAAGALTAKITLAFRLISSSMSSGNRSLRPSAHRSTKVTFWPST
jgi:hypothetical protein